ncbi:MAG: CHAD domain-containing protein [Acidobacteria bacterium]|nr:CHAD domain-containing protein [Acidobacteriota bacterium]MBS1867460.1 CHAD domain-containing protein [Acidobacteriota bacterium]
MAAVIPLPAKASEAKGLLYWMERALKERARVLASPDEEAIHDLRVALRRCRSLASVFEEVDPNPAWRDLRKASRKLFRSLGAIRDSQVQESWVLKLAGADNVLRTQILYAVKAGRDRQEREAKKNAAKFDEKAWTKLALALRSRLKLIPIDGPAAQCLALERLEEAAELHRRALRTEKPKPWHELRIGVKHFRYTVENLLPKQHASWSSDLKRVQDLLGDVHDLDVLLDTIRGAAPESPALDQWKETIARERTERIATYRQLTLGTTSLWNQWRLGLPTNGHVAEAAQARLLATAKAADPNRAKTAGTARLAKKLFKELKRAAASPIFKEQRLEVLATAVFLLHGIDPENSGKRAYKDARKFLTKLPPPPGWTGDEWRLLALTIRYQRGAAPSAESGRFAELEPAQQNRLLLIAGILRTVRSLQKMGVAPNVKIRVEPNPDSISILVEGFSEAQAAPNALVAGKRMLESALGKSIAFHALEKVEPMLPLEFPSATSKTLAAGAD